MFNIKDLMIGDFSTYPEDAREFMIKYTERLRENIKTELVEEMANRMLKDIDKSNETFVNVLSEILENGCKGFNEMSTEKLINIYLDRKDQTAFMELLERVNEEVK
jgi:polyhydroxyalkanoate synthesis regulator protein